MKTQIINIVIILAMVFFAIPKLLAKPQSIEGFKQFENAIHLNADIFRIFTGVSELALATLILVFAIKRHQVIGKIAFAFLLITMLTALILEFFARPEPKIVLVIIAIVLALLSLYRLNQLINPKIKQHDTRQ
ncbi:DoxX family protein [Olleya sp. HaHaR_3_96]|uniref:DoxX family protein n=1 Tax=Olleya sp. HaHaR_3_96 TaxID=2745560 RepID=UPI001C4F0D26|nr:DoxX family protein [Olleya sp. HaHaR_3_96]QXP61250.1 DoxX family protein [Olleya sp. HaHaR_3_96]